MSPTPSFRRPELVPGQRRRQRRRARRARRRRRTIVVLLIVAGALAATFAVSFGGAAALLDNCDLKMLQPAPSVANSFVYDGDGKLLGSIPAERNREPVQDLSDVSTWMRKATIAIEDRRFYQHGGVDWEGILRAAVRDIEAGRAVQGASTITQQLVRNLYPISNERTLERKTKRLLAIKLNRQHTKDWILREYLNAVYYGNHAYGVEAAAQTYFNRSARLLSLPQSALLAGLTQAPSDYDPFEQPAQALRRRNQVLRAMLDNGELTLREYRTAVRTKMELIDGRRHYDIDRVPPRDRYFFNYVREELVAQYGANTVRSGGLKVYTTVNRRLQRAAQTAIRTTLYDRSDPAAAVVAIDPETGEILAMTAETPGGKGNEFNFASQARRQAGSTFKTFVLTEAVKQGINPASTSYTSAPFTYQPDPLSPAWEVTTYGGDYYGSSSIESATLRSDNTVYARLTLDLGPERIAATAQDLGIRTPLPPYPSMGLGSIDVSPLEMASAYATLAAGGIYSEPTGIRKVILANGEEDYDAGWGVPEQRRVIEDWVAAEVTRILAENIQGGTGTGARFGRPAAGKTGTTENHGDAWFIGYTPNLATSVWIGYPDSVEAMTNVHGISVAGGTFPADIFRLFMIPAATNTPYTEFPPPNGEPEWRYDWQGQYQHEGGYDYDYGYDDEEEPEEEETEPEEQPSKPEREPSTPPAAQSPAPSTPTSPASPPSRPTRPLPPDPE